MKRKNVIQTLALASALAACLVCGAASARKRTAASSLTASQTASALVQAARASADGEVAALVARLDSPDAARRAEAACALGRMEAGARAAVPRLARLLADGTPVARTCGNAPPFEDEAWEPDYPTVKETTVGEAATQALMGIGDASDDALVGALTTAENWRARKNAAWALAHRGDARAMRAMRAALRDPAWQVRAEAAYALFQRGGDSADTVNALISAAGDEAWQVRRQAVFALGHKSGGPVSVAAPLLAAMRNDADARVRAEAAGALWHSADSRSFPTLIEALKDEDGGVRARVADTLGNRADNEDVPLLIAALKDPDARVREGARRALRIVKQRSEGRVTNLRPLPAGIPE